ncbi:unnamed protein product [Rhodiola kirilowii]
MKEGQSTSRPPLLGPNYDYWKSKMKAFLKSLDEKAWRAVLLGWTQSMMANAEEVIVPSLKHYRPTQTKRLLYGTQRL